MEHTRVNRYHNLDYLRGLMAFAVMVFHVEKWQTQTWDSGSIQGKLGVYAVEVFFILSGLTLAMVYGQNFNWQQYVIKRILRIFPLLWVVTGVSVFISDAPVSGSNLLLNFSGLFGFYDASCDISTGAWSIGNELVFYSLFPFFFWIYQYKKAVFYAILALVVTVFCHQAFENLLNPFPAQSVWWPAYVQWYNHLIFFLTGMAIAFNKKNLIHLPNAFWTGMSITLLFLFYWIGTGKDPYTLVVGKYRCYYSILSIMLVLAWFYVDFSFLHVFSKALSWLGAISYSLYLWHPVVFRAIKSMAGYADMNTLDWPLTLGAIMGSLFVAHLSYFYFERPVLMLIRR